MRRRASRRGGWRGWRVWALAAAAGAVILGPGALWRPSGETVEGTPRLVVDTETIDLGGLPFAAPARAVFTLANAGTGLLRIVEAPRVVLAKGC